MSKKDYYETLEISKSASQDEIKKAYRKLAMKYHPDQNKDNPTSEAKFKEISEAYEVLKDTQKKAAYDRFGHNAFNQQGGRGSGFGQSSGFSGGFEGFNGEFSDIFGDFFSDVMGGRKTRASTNKRGSDLKYNLNITLGEAFNGAVKKINFKTNTKCSSCLGKGSKNPNGFKTCHTCHGHGAVRVQQGFFAIEQLCSTCQGAGKILKDPCSSCHGEGRTQDNKELSVEIPAGIEDGNRIRYSGDGEAGLRGGPSGDLYIFVSIKEHDLFKLQGYDIHARVPISFSVAALGGEVEVPTIDDKNVILKIPAGTQNGEKLKLKDRGMSKVRSSSRGNMICHIHIEVPKKLSSKQKTMIKELAEEFGDENAYKGQSLFDKMKNLWS